MAQKPGKDHDKGAKRRPRGLEPETGFVLPNVRILHVTIFVAAMMLTVRATDIWRGINTASIPELALNQSEAQQPPPPGGRKRGQRSPQTPIDSQASTGGAGEGSSGPIPGLNTGQAAGSAPANGSPPAVPPAAAGENEPPSFTPNEVDVLQKLAERREALDSRSRDLDLRENLVKAAEERIDKKITEMKALQASVESMLKQVDDQDDAKMKSLVKIYENMKPKDAAKIFEQLDLPILLGVMSRMKEQKVAPIMEAMDPMKAKTITDAMAVRRTTRAEGQGG